MKARNDNGTTCIHWWTSYSEMSRQRVCYSCGYTETDASAVLELGFSPPVTAYALPSPTHWAPLTPPESESK